MLYFADVLHVLELPQLGEGVVPEGFVQRRVSVLVRYVQVASLAHQQLHTPAHTTSVCCPVCSPHLVLNPLAFVFCFKGRWGERVREREGERERGERE